MYLPKLKLIRILFIKNTFLEVEQARSVDGEQGAFVDIDDIQRFSQLRTKSASDLDLTKGQLIAKCPFGVKTSSKKTEIFSRISALVFKIRSNQKKIGGFYLTLLHNFFDLSSF